MSNATAGLGLGVRVLGLQGLGLRAQREETHLPLKFLSHQMNHCVVIMATSCYEYVLYEFNFSMTGSKKVVQQAETNKQYNRLASCWKPYAITKPWALSFDKKNWTWIMTSTLFLCEKSMLVFFCGWMFVCWVAEQSNPFSGSWMSRCACKIVCEEIFHF